MPTLSSLDRLIDGMNKKYGKGVVLDRRNAFGFDNVQRVPIDSPKLGKIFGNGGVPIGRVIELFGMESSGKSSVCEYVAGFFQRHKFKHTDENGNVTERNGIVAYIDTENSFVREYAEKQGFDIDKAIIVSPPDGETAFNIACEFAESGEVDLIIIDSLTACTPRAIIEGDMEQQTMGLLARLSSKFLSKIVGILGKHNCTLMFTNQMRASLNMYGNPYTTTGGNALPFYASVRIQTSRKEYLLDGDNNPIGITIKVRSVKNKTAVPNISELITMYYDTGIDATAEWIEFALEKGVITKGGSFYTLPDGSKIRGYDHLKSFLLDVKNKVIYDDIIVRTKKLVDADTKPEAPVDGESKVVDKAEEKGESDVEN